MTANPWGLARAIWPGAFAEPWQDEQIEQGRGNWPTVCVLWRGAMANPPLGVPASHSPITSWLRVLELRHVATGALHWRYRDEPAVDLRRPGRWPDHNDMLREARALGYRWWAARLTQGPIEQRLPELRLVASQRRLKPDLGAFDRLVVDGVVSVERMRCGVAGKLEAHRRRESRVVRSLFGGAP